MNPTIEWRDLNRLRCLFLHFDGTLTADEAKRAISEIRPMLRSGAEQFAMVWECTMMAGYEPEAREAWQVFIGEIRPRLSAVHLVTPNVAIRSGAMVIGIFAGLRITTWATLADLVAKA